MEKQKHITTELITGNEMLLKGAKDVETYVDYSDYLNQFAIDIKTLEDKAEEVTKL